MSDKFDQINITVGKILNKMKKLKEQNIKRNESNEKLKAEIQQLKGKVL
jgi:hypothetical protein